MTLTFISVMADLPLSSWLWTCPQSNLVEGQLMHKVCLGPCLYSNFTHAFPSPLHCPFLSSLSGPGWHTISSAVITWSCTVHIRFSLAPAIFPVRGGREYGG